MEETRLLEKQESDRSASADLSVFSFWGLFSDNIAELLLYIGYENSVADETVKMHVKDRRILETESLKYPFRMMNIKLEKLKLI